MKDNKTLMEMFNNPQHDEPEDGYLVYLGGSKIKYILTINHPASSYGVPILVDHEGNAFGIDDQCPIEGLSNTPTKSGAQLVQDSIDQERKIDGKPLFSYKWQAEMVAKFFGVDLNNFKWQLDENNNYVEG